MDSHHTAICAITTSVQYAFGITSNNRGKAIICTHSLNGMRPADIAPRWPAPDHNSAISARKRDSNHQEETLTKQQAYLTTTATRNKTSLAWEKVGS